MKPETSNYEISSRGARALFLRYDQERMIRAFRMNHDEQYLYLRFLSAPYRVDRKTGQVQKQTQGGWEAEKPGFEEIMSIYDYICNPNGPMIPSGRWTSVQQMNRLRSGTKTLGTGLNERGESFLMGKTREVAQACRELGGMPAPVGDAAFYLPVFEEMPVYFQFWDGDEDFPPKVQILWDENTLRCIHFETTFYITGYLLELLERGVRRQARGETEP